MRKDKVQLPKEFETVQRASQKTLAVLKTLRHQMPIRTSNAFLSEHNSGMDRGQKCPQKRSERVGFPVKPQGSGLKQEVGGVSAAKQL